MSGYYDFGRGLNYAISKFTDSEILKYSAFVAFITLIIGLSGLFVVENPLLYMAIYLVAYALLLFYVVPVFVRKTMEKVGIKVGKFPSLVDWFVMNIRMILVNVFCWYDKKLLTPAIICLVLAVLVLVLAITSIIEFELGAMISFVIIMLMIAVWAVAITIHSIRTGFGQYLFLGKEINESEALKMSHNIIKGQTFQAFLPQIMISLVVAIPILIVVIASFVLIGQNDLVINVLTFLWTIPAVAISMVFVTDMYKFFFENTKANATVIKNVEHKDSKIAKKKKHSVKSKKKKK